MRFANPLLQIPLGEHRWLDSAVVSHNDDNAGHPSSFLQSNCKVGEDESKEKPTDDSSNSPYELEDKYSHPINEPTKSGNEGADNNLNEVQQKASEVESEEKPTDDSSNSPYELEDKYGNPINEQTKPGHEIEDKYNYGKQKGKNSNSSDDTKKIDH